MFFDDVKTLYDLEAPEAGRVKVDQIYSDYRKGAPAQLDTLAQLPLQDLKVIDLDTGNRSRPSKDGAATLVKLDVPIADDKQSAHLKITGTFQRPATRCCTTNCCSTGRCTVCATPSCCLRAGNFRRCRSRAPSAPIEGRTFVAADQPERREQLSRHAARTETRV